MRAPLASAGLGLASLALLAAAPAAAQDYLTPAQRAQAELRLNELQAQADMARQRDVAVQNQLMALDARLRAEQGVADVRAQAVSPRLPPVYQAYPGAPPPSIDVSKLASIPDSALAESDRRVRDAAQNRR